MTRTNRRLKIGFVVLLALISLSGIFSRSLWKPDEPRVAEIGREMWLNHQYVIPTLNRKPFLEKPPLYWWVMSAGFSIFGVSDGTARLPSALFGFLTLLFTYLIGRRIANEKTGLFAALTLATLIEFSIISHRCLVDNALIFFVTLGYYGFFHAYISAAKRDKWIGYELMALACGLAFLSKGMVGPGLIAGPAVIALLVLRDFGELKRILPQIGVGILLFLAIVAPWLLGLYLQGRGNAFQEFLLQNTLGRILPSAVSHYVGGHKHSFFYYFRKLPQDFLPWILAFPATLSFLFRARSTGPEGRKKGLSLALLMFLGGFLLLSLASTKRGLYLVPLYPLFSICIGGWFTIVCDKKTPLPSLDKITLLSFLIISAVIPLFVALGASFIALMGVGPKGYDMRLVAHRLKPLLGVIVPLGLLAFFILGKKALGCIKGKGRPTCLPIFLTAVVLTLAYHEGAVRFMDPVKNIHRFTEKMRPYLQPNAPIAGYKIDELTRGMIPFDTGEYIRTFTNLADLTEFLKNHPNALLVIPKSEVDLLPAFLKRQLFPLARHDYSHHFKLRLYRWNPVPPEKPPKRPPFSVPSESGQEM